ncbi:MAG: LysM repeat protein [Glaciecola sp.]|jgi:LysM repeat protein
MQQIERYGVIALLFLLVTIVVVALWDGGDPTETPKGEIGTVAQVDKPRTQAQARTQRSTVPNRGTRTQAQNQAQLQAQKRASLSRSQAQQKALEKRGRLLNLNGVPADADARGSRRNSRLSQRATPGTGGSQPLKTGAVNKAQVPAPFTSEPRRGRDTNQWGRNNGPIANTTTPAVKPISAVREMRNQAKKEARRKPEPVKGPLYVVKPGDSLARIARINLGSEGRWREIQELNGLKSDVVIVGKKLRLPMGADISRTTVAAAKKKARGISQEASSRAGAPRETEAGYYVVKSGDYLGKIAEQELGSSKRVGDILKLNPGMNKDRVLVGDKLRMPIHGTVARTSQRSTPSRKRLQAKADSRFTVH